VLPVRAFQTWIPESISGLSTCRLLGFSSQPASDHSNNIPAVKLRSISKNRSRQRKGQVYSRLGKYSQLGMGMDLQVAVKLNPAPGTPGCVSGHDF